MNEIEVFSNEQFGKVRTIIKDGQIWFCLTDICKILEIGNAADVKKRLIEGGIDKIEVGLKIGVRRDGTDIIQEMPMIFVNEANLYKTIFQSRKPEAEKFSDWVTSEVLPTIRKHGIYATDNVIDQILNNPDFGIELLTTLKKECKARIEADRKNSILMHVNKTYTATEIADVIKEFIEYAKKQGSKHANMYYIHFSKLANKIAGINGNMRDLINAHQLMYLSIAESTILKTVMRGMEQNLEYKKIYEECKRRLDILNDLAVIEKPVEQFKQERIEANVAV